MAEPPSTDRWRDPDRSRRILSPQTASDLCPEPDPIPTPGDRRPPRRCHLAPIQTNRLLPPANTHPNTSTIEVLQRPVESTQFTSWTFTRRVHESGLIPSMGSIGDCYDNAVIEAFWGRMQTELLNRRTWRTRIELANSMFEYLEIFHNRRRRHSALGMLTPLEYETLYQQRQPVA